MKYCTFCGAQLEDNALFCTECGTPVEESQKIEISIEEDNEGSKANLLQSVSTSNVEKAVILAYFFWVGFIISYFAFDKNDPFVKFHLNQALWVHLLFLFSLIPMFGSVVWIVGLAAMIYEIVNAIQGKMVELPVIGKNRLIK